MKPIKIEVKQTQDYVSPDMSLLSNTGSSQFSSSSVDMMEKVRKTSRSLQGRFEQWRPRSHRGLHWPQ